MDGPLATATLMRQYLTYMSCSELFKFDPTPQRLHKEVAKLPTEWVVRTCGFLEYLRGEQSRLGIDLQSHALEAFSPPPLRRDLLDHARRTRQFFLYEEQLLGLIKLAILHGISVKPPVMSPEQQRAFFWSLMLYGDLHSAEIGEIGQADDAARMELRGLAFGAEEVPGNVMARAHALWIDLPARPDLTTSSYFIDVPAEFAHATGGHPIADYLTVASVVLAHARDAVHDSIFESLGRWPFNPAARFASSRRAAELTATMRAFAHDRQEFGPLFRQMPAHPRYLGVAMLPFIHRPLYLTDAGHYLIISMRLILDGLYDLAYWRVWEHLKNEHGPQGEALSARFTQFYGQILERYVVELLRSVYDTGKKRVFAESEAQPPTGAADAAVFLDDRVILVEVTKTDLRYFETLLKGDLEHFDQDLARTADKTRQLATAADAVQNGGVRYPGHDEAVRSRIERIVVVPNPLPRFPFVNERVRAALAAAGVDPDATILSVGELEEGLVANDLTHLSDLIAAWKAEPGLSESSFHNFVRLRTPVVPMDKRAPYLAENAELLRKRTIQEMAFRT